MAQNPPYPRDATGQAGGAPSKRTDDDDFYSLFGSDEEEEDEEQDLDLDPSLTGQDNIDPELLGEEECESPSAHLPATPTTGWENSQEAEVYPNPAHIRNTTQPAQAGKGYSPQGHVDNTGSNVHGSGQIRNDYEWDQNPRIPRAPGHSYPVHAQPPPLTRPQPPQQPSETPPRPAHRRRSKAQRPIQRRSAPPRPKSLPPDILLRPLPRREDGSEVPLKEIDTFPYYDDGPKIIGEVDSGWARRVQNFRNANDIRRKQKVAPHERVDRGNMTVDEYKTAKKRAQDLRRRKKLTTNEDHQNRLTEGHPRYDPTYAAAWFAARDADRAHNSLVRQAALEARWKADAARGLAKVEKPMLPDDDDFIFYDDEFEVRKGATTEGKKLLLAKTEEMMAAREARGEGTPIPMPKTDARCGRCKHTKQKCDLSGAPGRLKYPPCTKCEEDGHGRYCEVSGPVKRRARKMGTIIPAKDPQARPDVGGKQADDRGRKGQKGRQNEGRKRSASPLTQPAQPSSYRKRDDYDRGNLPGPSRPHRIQQPHYGDMRDGHPQPAYQPPQQYQYYPPRPQQQQNFGNAPEATTNIWGEPLQQEEYGQGIMTSHNIQRPPSNMNMHMSNAHIAPPHDPFGMQPIGDGQQSQMNNTPRQVLQEASQNWLNRQPLQPSQSAGPSQSQYHQTTMENIDPTLFSHDHSIRQPPVIPQVPRLALPTDMTYVYDGSQAINCPYSSLFRDRGGSHYPQPMQYTNVTPLGEPCCEDPNQFFALDPGVAKSDVICGNETTMRCSSSDHQLQGQEFWTCDQCRRYQDHHYSQGNDQTIHDAKAYLCLSCARSLWDDKRENIKLQNSCDCARWIKNVWLCNFHRMLHGREMEDMLEGVKRDEVQFIDAQRTCVGCARGKPYKGQGRAWGCRVCRCWVVTTKPPR